MDYLEQDKRLSDKQFGYHSKCSTLLLFFNDLKDCLQHSNVVQFADDIAMYLSSKSIDEIEVNLNEDLALISTYLSCNDLVINLKKGKTECMLLGTSKPIATLHPFREI